MTIETTRQDILPIQMLRGIAATMVVFVHLDLQLNRLGYGSINSHWLASGVDIFFVISGFIMWVSVEKRGGMTPWAFLRNRLIRIVPLYWLVSLGILVTIFVAPSVLRTTVFDAPHALASFAFLPARHPVTGEFWPLLVPGWTLNCEMLFYLLFTLAIAASAGLRRRRFVVIAGSIFGTLVVANLLGGSIDVMNFYANPILIEFLAGICVGVVYLSRRIAVSWLWLASVAIGFLLLWQGHQLGLASVLVNGTAATMIVLGALFSPPIQVPGLRQVGDASYSLYLTHVITLAAVAQLWRQGIQFLGSPVFVPLALVLCMVVALLSYRFLERPMTTALKRISFVLPAPARA